MDEGVGRAILGQRALRFDSSLCSLYVLSSRGLNCRRERGRVAAREFGGGNRRPADQLLEGVGHTVVAVAAMQLAHGDQVCDQMRRQLSLVERKTKANAGPA